MEELARELRELLLANGASLVAYGDLSGVEGAQGYPVGISIAVALDPAVVAAIAPLPPAIYTLEYRRLNALLNQLDEQAAEFLTQRGFRAHPQTQSWVTIGEGHRTALPHKTVATRTGLGWIGKTALLVTDSFGPAVRISSVLTDAPLPLAQPHDASRCGSCHACVDACPAHAASGEPWRLGMPRESFFDADACDAHMSSVPQPLGSKDRVCGLCIAACPRARSYVCCTGTAP